jgi:hypothetical protein
MFRFACMSAFRLLGLALALFSFQFVQAQAGDPKLTEVYSPVPPVVTPGASCQDAPSDAIILFNGTNLDAWRSANDTLQPAKWTVADGIMTVKKGNITGTGQARGNSGVFLASTGAGDGGYELQVLDSYNNSTYTNGQAASIYKQSIPLANACRKPGEWQSYDVVWTGPRFNDDGTLKTAAKVTVLHNGVLVQNDYQLKGETRYIGAPFYKKHGPCPIKLQSHGDPSEPISYRNIWVRPL